LRSRNRIQSADRNYRQECKKPDRSGVKITGRIVKMYLIETKELGSKKWKEEPIKFEKLEDAEEYARKLYQQVVCARVVDERYRK
jgi:hypothetical protein